jgi:hypothetical protein
VLRHRPDGCGLAPEHYRRPASKTDERAIEAIELRERGAIVERRTTGDDSAPSDSLPELGRGAQSVLPTF